jgi:hypothetical protein
MALMALLPALLIMGCGGDSENEKPVQPFAPQATLTAVGGTERADKPKFVIRVTTRPGDPNIRSARVNLPPVVFVDAVAIEGFCSEKELAADDCHGHQRLGSARVLSPAYEGALSGPVYAVSGSGRLPGLAYVLGGSAEIVLRGKVTSTGGRIEAGVEDVPDVPLKSFEFTLEGGKGGYLLLSHDICNGQPTADATFISQDGRTHRAEVPLTAECGA